MRAPGLSIRALLLLTVGGLTAIITCLAAADVYENWQRLTTMRALRDASLVGDDLFDATEKLSVERDIALSMLQAPDADTVEDLRPRLLEARRAADTALNTGLRRLDSYAFPELATLRATSLSRLSEIQALRPQIDRAVALAKPARDTKLPDKWSSDVSSLLNDTENLWVNFVKHFSDVDPIVTQHLRFKHLLRTIIDYSGRERSLIGQLIAENADPTTQQVAQLLRGQGAVDLSWQMTRVIASQSGLYDSISAAYTDALSHYQTMHEMIQDMFYVPGSRHGGTYPIGVDLWFELSTQASDSLAALREASVQATRRYNDGLIGGAERAITLWSCVLLASLVLCAYSFLVITGRVIRPINGMIEALLGATRGETVAFAVAEGRHDEIGKLADVLHAFQENVENIKQTAIKLDRSESQLRAVVDHTVDGMITVSATGTIISFNPACEHIFGRSADETVGSDVRTLVTDASQSALNAYFLACLDAAASRGEAPPSRELHANRRDGSHFPIDLSLSAFRLEGQQHFSAIVRDITRRKHTELELLLHTRALERSNKELDDFAYIASHDLKEPLRGIHNHARFLLEDNADKLDSESVGRLSRLVYLSQRMERLVNDLLYFSRLGRHELAVQSTDIGEVVADIESTISDFLTERGARIVVGTPLPQVTCDKTRVTELFRNLITNAVKYNDKQEKTIEIGWKAEQAMPDGQVERSVFYVKDDGRGIDPEFHTEIFRIFKRLQGVTEKEEGTGVGLTFVKKIVERHGGRIWLDSALGKGTTFYFTLEASRDEHDLESQIAA